MTNIQSVVAILKKASLMGAFFLLLSCHSSASTLFCSVNNVPAEHAVEYVVDGDTLRLNDQRRVRLIGIDAPEMGSRGRSAEPFAVQATRRLTELVKANHNQVGLLVGEQSHDRYGRVLAHLYDRHGLSLEEQLIAEGLAYHVVIAPNIALADCLAQAEQSARERQVGLWKTARFTPADKLNKGGFTLLQGRIKHVERNKGGIWLDLGHSVTINIPLSALQYFQGVNFEQLQGRRLKSRGWISERKGQPKRHAKWRLTVSHPSMLELQ